MKLGIIGTGLIGGSLGLSLKERCGDKYRIFCYNRTGKNSKAALDKGAADEACDSIEELTQISDVIVICAHLSSYASIASKMSNYLDNNKVITDVGSVKVKPTEEFLKNIDDKYHTCFIPCHPIAGKESGGIENAEAGLFDGKMNIITPKAENSQSTKVREMWSDTGAINRALDIEEHDRIYAKTSHLPQYLSYALKKYFYGKPEFIEFIRLSDSPFDLWKDIFSYNEKNIFRIKKDFFNKFELEKEKFFSRAKKSTIQNQEADEIFASLVASSMKSLVEDNEQEFCGSGYKSIVSILSKNILQKEHSYSSYLEKNISEFINDVKNSSISRNF